MTVAAPTLAVAEDKTLPKPDKFAVKRSLAYFLVALPAGAAVLFWLVTRDAAPDAPAEARHPSRSTRSSPPGAVSNKAPSHLLALKEISVPWQARIELLRNALQTECGEQELLYLYRLLSEGPQQGEIPEHWYVIANDLMEQLRRRDSDERRFSSAMLGILEDSRQPPVIRDYAVQHLAAWLNPARPAANRPVSNAGTPDSGTGTFPETGDGQPRPAEIASEVLSALVKAATNPEHESGTIPGTTLMMLVELSRSPGGVDCRDAIASLKPWLHNALGDSSVLDTPTRVSAIQAAAALAPGEFLPVIRKIAFAPEGQSSLRLPAIASLAFCGEASDLEILGDIANNHPELSYAAKDAGTCLTKRLSPPSPTH